MSKFQLSPRGENTALPTDSWKACGKPWDFKHISLFFK